MTRASRLAFGLSTVCLSPVDYTAPGPEGKGGGLTPIEGEKEIIIDQSITEDGAW